MLSHAKIQKALELLNLIYPDSKQPTSSDSKKSSPKPDTTLTPKNVAPKPTIIPKLIFSENPSNPPCKEFHPAHGTNAITNVTLCSKL